MQYITPLAPWQEGLCERVLGVKKMAFRSAVSRNYMTEEVENILAEVEVIINSRPIMQIAEDAMVLLRFYHFIILRSILSIPMGELKTLFGREKKTKNINLPVSTQREPWKRWSRSSKAVDKFRKQ